MSIIRDADCIAPQLVLEMESTYSEKHLATISYGPLCAHHPAQEGCLDNRGRARSTYLGFTLPVAGVLAGCKRKRKTVCALSTLQQCLLQL